MKTKKPKSVHVKWKKFTYTRLESEYQCPNCKAVYINNINKKVTRFICDCGQELIVSSGEETK